MGPRFLLDEHLRGPLSAALRRHNALPGNAPIPFGCVGDPDAPRRGSADPEILEWAYREGFVVLSQDRRTMTEDWSDRLRSGLHSPGLLVLPHQFQIPGILEFLTVAVLGSEAEEWIDSLHYL